MLSSRSRKRTNPRMDTATYDALLTVMRTAKRYGVDDECFDEFMQVVDWLRDNPKDR
jgi:hypothetical protein